MQLPSSNQKLHLSHFLEKYFAPFIIDVTIMPTCNFFTAKLMLSQISSNEQMKLELKLFPEYIMLF